MLVSILQVLLISIAVMIVVYTVRHYIFTMNRLFGEQRHPYINIEDANWPRVTIMVPAHNEEAVIDHSLQSLLQVNYPKDKIEILVVNDRSEDKTEDIVDRYVAQYPDQIRAFHRREGNPGKPAALKDAMELVKSELIILFDADYIPGHGLVKQLVAPFFDPEVGLVMGRVVPVNTGKNLLTRLLDLERSGGYQVDQQARMNLDLTPQYGGTVGGIRVAALESVGGWQDDTLAEDTDITCRAIMDGWKSVYQNRSECYEEVPENWNARTHQISRWAKGHNQSFCRYGFRCLFNKNLNFAQKIDSFLLLGVYFMSPMILMGWILAMFLFYTGHHDLMNLQIALLAIAAFGTIGNFAAFFEIGSAVYLDRGTNRIRLLPLNLFNFLISVVTVSKATFSGLFDPKVGCPIWAKTPRYRTASFVLSSL